MIRDARRTLPALTLGVAVLALVTACTAGPESDADASSDSASDASGSADPAAEQTACEALIIPTTVAALEEQGWTAQQRDFSIGPDVLEGGLQCLWADYSKASDHGLLYGWAPIGADSAAEFQEQLLSQGWVREDGAEGVYITTDPQFTLTSDEDGYGMTYLFGDGWVTVSDTKQGLLLIRNPG